MKVHRKGKNIRTAVRKIIKGSSVYLISLPKDFLKGAGLKVGDEVGLIYNDNVLKVIPLKEDMWWDYLIQG